MNAHLGSQLDCSDSPDVNQPYAEACRLLALHDRPPFLSRPSLTGHCGHCWTCSLPRPVAIDPTRTLGLAQKSPRIGLRGTLREHPPRGDLSPAFRYRRAFCPSDAAGDWHDRRTIRRRSVCVMAAAPVRALARDLAATVDRPHLAKADAMDCARAEGNIHVQGSLGTLLGARRRRFADSSSFRHRAGRKRHLRVSRAVSRRDACERDAAPSPRLLPANSAIAL